MAPKITNFIIALALVGMCIAILGNFMGEVAEKSGVLYDESNITAYNKITQLHNQTKQLRNESEQIRSTAGVLDLLGDVFESASTVVKEALTSFGLFGDMVDHAERTSGLGEEGSIILDTIKTIVLISLILGVLIAAFMKWYI